MVLALLCDHCLVCFSIHKFIGVTSIVHTEFNHPPILVRRRIDNLGCIDKIIIHLA